MSTPRSVDGQTVGPRATSGAGSRELSARDISAWRVFLRAHAYVTRRLEHDLLVEHDMPLAFYDVLLQLAERPDRRLRMTDLADQVLLSRSGLTRLVDRLAAEGLVERQSCPSDARGTFTVLTEAGLGRLRRAAPTHLRGVQEYVTSRLSPAELDTLAALLRRLLSDGEGQPPLDGDCGATDPPAPRAATSPAGAAPAGPGSGGPASGGPGSGGPGSGGPASGGPASGGPAPGGPASGVAWAGVTSPGAAGSGGSTGSGCAVQVPPPRSAPD